MTCVVIGYPGNEELAAALCRHLNAELVPIESRQFPDGELYFRVSGVIAGRDVVVACSLDRPNEKALGLMLLAPTLRELGAVRITLAAPYLAYMRQDRVFRRGEGVSALHFASLLSTSFDALVTVDPHLHRIHALPEIFTIATRVIHAAPAVATWIGRNVLNPVVIGPDEESEQWVRAIAAAADAPFQVLKKRRLGDRSVEVSLPNVDGLYGRTPVLVDDIISTGQTMIAAVKQLRELSLPGPVCVAVHAIFAGHAYETLGAAGAVQIVTCNTVKHASNAIDLHALIAQAIVDLRDKSAPDAEHTGPTRWRRQ